MGDLLREWAGVSHLSLPIGAVQEVCPGCKKKFSACLARGMTLRLYRSDLPVPIATQYDVCVQCTGTYRAGGHARNQVLEAIEVFFIGKGE